MENKSRTEYSAMNTTVAIVSRMTAILMGFATRVVFTRILGESYVGINGLFTVILNMFSLTELGVGTAITYALYGPIARKDIRKQQILMRMYRTFYHVMAVCVAAIGLLVIPFMDILMKNRPKIDHLVLIYLLYLANTVLSYLFVYKQILIEAHQRNYIVLLYQTFFFVIQDIGQIVILITTRNFILFLLVYIICTLTNNVMISRKADHMFPYLKESCKERLPEQDRHEIFRDIKAMLMHKIGSVVINNTDNLIISSFVGVVSVGIYSNYYLLIGSVRQVLDQIFQGITASVGNLGATEENHHIRNIFELSFFIAQWIYGFAAICMYELLNPFVEISFGRNYQFAKEIVLILCINFFVNGMRKAVLTFHDSMGLFWFDRYKALVETILNLVASIILVRTYGIFGVFLATLISTLLTSVWVEPFVIYRERLRTSPWPFYLQYIIYVGIMGGVWFLTDCMCSFATGNIWLIFFERLIICVMVPNLLLLLIYFRKKEFRSLRVRARNIWNRKEQRHGTSVK